ncbi:MAG: tRNA lysidine(34) synthetase TilS [Verrucomicrobiota bacterium]
MTSLLEHVEKSIQSHCLFQRNERIVVGVSGGLDSMVLLHLLYRLSGKYHWRISVAHYNHQLRGRSSDADERLVQKTAAFLKLNYNIERADVAAFAKANHLSIEMAARKLRHQFLALLSKRMKIRTVALGHHCDDQVELFFLRLFRGASGEGLAGMKWKSVSSADKSVQLVRPFLDQPKEVLREYARREGILFREDASNASIDFQRNRIRHELIPLLNANYQPALKRTTLRTMEIIGTESQFTMLAAVDWMAKKKKPPFSRLHPAVQRSAIRLQLLSNKISVDFDLVEGLREITGKAFNVGSNTSVSRRPDGLISFKSSESEILSNENLVEHALGKRKGKIVFDGVQIDWLHLTLGIPLYAPAANCEIFDAKKIGAVVLLRHWRAGDRFQPIGMKTSVKLQNLFTNLKVSKEERHRRIVAQTEQGEIFWVEGLRIGECFKLDKRTVRRLKWSWRRV